MKPIFAIALLALPLSAAEPAEPRTPQPRLVPMANRAPSAWLGLKVAKPDETITAQVPSLPQGIGFVVKSVDEGSPAAASGLARHDLVWKLGDQMLVNESQLAALLRLSKPGDDVVISCFRGGQPLEVKLKLGEAPAFEKPVSGELLEAAMLPGSCDLPMRVVDVAGKSASFSAEEGTAVVRHEKEGYHVKISARDNQTIFEGDLSKDDPLESLPEAWRKKIHVLCRTLDHTLDGGIAPQRPPRPRVVMSAAPAP